MSLLQPPPGPGLYLHLPWCLRKCPYCDFNSHPLAGEVPEQAYVEALLADLEHDLPLLGGRSIASVFIGGGTPSLFSGRAIGRLLEGIASRLPLAGDVEITLEANPGTVDAGRFRDYRGAGVNRLSLGVQSFDDRMLERLGRIHDATQARLAFATARAAGFDNINLDLMFGLPGQDPGQALDDLAQALALAPEHLSWYELTLEPGTPFHHHPPRLPAEEELVRMQEAGLERLEAAGYHRYEVSAFALEGRACRHNLNYWRYGDYLGIGAGAHGKLTTGDTILRRRRPGHPGHYLAGAGDPRRLEEQEVPPEERPLEFMMNAMRLVDGVPAALFPERTGLSLASCAGAVEQAVGAGLMESAESLRPTPAGLRYLNDLLALFLPE